MNLDQTIQYIYSNYDDIIKVSFSYTKNSEISKDCLSRVVIKILETNPEVLNHKTFISKSMFQQYLNYHTINKRYAYGRIIPDIPAEEPESFDFLNLEVVADMERNLENILTKKEYQAIITFLDTGLTIGISGDGNTNKAHFRNAVNKLKDWTQNELNLN